MITEIIFIILTFLITGYGIYRFGREEEPGQQIEAQGNGGDQNNANNNVPRNNNINNINLSNNNININNLNPSNNNININNNGKGINNNNVQTDFELQVRRTIGIKERNKNIDWGEPTYTAKQIYESITGNIQLPQKELALEQIKNILNEEKLKRGKEAVNNWLEKNNVNIEDRNIQEIADQFHNSEENNYTFKGEDYFFSKFLLTREEIESIIGRIKPCIVLQKQGNAFKELERQVEMKKEKKRREEEEERKKELEEEKKLEEIDRKRKEYDEEVENAKQILSEEPDDNNPDTCHIIFHSPDRSKSWGRRFLKTDKISTLYIYVKTLGREIFTEPDSTDFDIFSPGVPPKNLKDYKSNTLGKEGLCPNAEIQIQEIQCKLL